jgi:hypothetical protein
MDNNYIKITIRKELAIMNCVHYKETTAAMKSK